MSKKEEMIRTLLFNFTRLLGRGDVVVQRLRQNITDFYNKSWRQLGGSEGQSKTETLVTLMIVRSDQKCFHLTQEQRY